MGEIDVKGAYTNDDVPSPSAHSSACQALPPFRPIQYLGNKLRALPDILDATRELIGEEGHVADLFTGTTVVAQALAGWGYKVSAVDTQLYAAIFSRALLGIGRANGDTCDFATFLRLGIGESSSEIRNAWTLYVDEERRALQNDDFEALSALSARLPLIWKDKSHPFHRHIENTFDKSAVGEIALITSIYAGSYFGVQQALAIDELRQKIETLRQTGQISGWQYNAGLTAIMTAASAASHSAGKHFAQPLNAGTLRNSKFLSSRLLQDRNVSVMAEFRLACDQINARINRVQDSHVAWHGPAEAFAASGQPVDLYYLDPPYTAQQYSRFYHVLETISAYRYPQLFLNGKLTTGLYPTQRFKSDFSSKRKSPAAFRSIIDAASDSGAAVLISYSVSSAASNGNARMISLEALLDLCRSAFGESKVDLVRLNHRYRQFNSSTASNTHRNDPEIMITCRRR
jgi:adenine-specific DNA-methyltransferase